MNFTDDQLLDYIFKLSDQNNKAIEQEISNCPETRKAYETLLRQFAQLDSIQEHHQTKKSYRALSVIAALIAIACLLYPTQKPLHKVTVSKKISSPPTSTTNNAITLLNEISLSATDIQARFQINFPTPKLLKETNFTTPPEINTFLESTPLRLGTPTLVSEGKSFSLQCNISLSNKTNNKNNVN